MTGNERLKELYKSTLNKDAFLIEVIRYLLQLPDMNEKYLNEEKNLKQMREYIFSKAKEVAVDNAAAVKDEVVYSWAYEYFDKSNEELGLNKPVTNVATTKVAKTSKKEEVNVNQMTLELS